MKVTDIIERKINRLPVGYVFTYDDFTLPVDKVFAFTKALSRMVQEGKIRKLSPGRFYKPRFTDFGELKPDVYQVVKDLLEQNGKILGYLTGYSSYNQLGLSTQVSSIIQIGANEPKKGMTRGMYKIRFIKQPNTITKENIPLLRILDAIRHIKEIPDTTVCDSCKTLLTLIKNIKKEDRETAVRLARKYNPATRALSGAMFDLCFSSNLSEPLLKSLNPSSEYDFGITDDILPNKTKWNIR
ncbi:MAG: hypothetical protein BWY70_00619 [Bacteroidetes bacterium ADurb.Bin408]|nr:MAG: hypothetical protein BWY70_00619 [Bacteroidetes bacterium ADurb.Bin408]